MKNVLLIIGVIFLLIAIIRGGGYMMDYDDLSKYGKGYVWGNVAIGIIGFLLIAFNLKKRKDQKI